MKVNNYFFVIVVNLQTTFVRDRKQEPGNKTDFANLCFLVVNNTVCKIFWYNIIFCIIVAIGSSISAP